MSKLTYKELEKSEAECRKTEETLLNSLSRYEAVFGGSRDAIFISNNESKFYEVNEAACDLTGYSKNELLKMSIPDLHEKMDLEAYNEYHDLIMEGEETVSESKILKKDGSKVGLTADDGTKLRFQDLRHVYAYFAHNAGTFLDKLRVLMTHKERSTTDRYARLSSKSIIKSLDNFPAIREAGNE